MADLYRVLQVDPSADAEVIEAAYKRLARKFHPDVSPRPDADARIRELNAAYEVLGDALRRAAYDQRRVRAFGAAAAVASRPRKPPPRPAPASRRPPRLRLRRPVLAATAAGLAAAVLAAGLSAQLFSPALDTRIDEANAVVLVVTSAAEPTVPPEPLARPRATPTPSGWPPAIYVQADVEPEHPAQVDLFSKFVGAARQVTRRLQGPMPPERPYNPAPP